MSASHPAAVGVSSSAERRHVMAVCAHATLAELADGIAAVAPDLAATVVRPPELGLVMLRGRAGGDGAPFNLGEATVARAAVRLSSGEMGLGYVLGRSLEKARLAAIVDALAQVPAHRPALQRALIEPVEARRLRERSVTAAETAATKVDFFTLVRGED